MTGALMPQLPRAVTERPAPTLSETLHKFMQERGAPGRQTTAVAFPYTETLPPDVRKFWGDFDRSAEAQAATRVMQGYCLACIRYLSPGEFVSGLAERGLATSSAYELMDDYVAFNSLPNLNQVGRLSEIGASKTRLLAKALGSELPKFLDGEATFYGMTPAEVEASKVADLVKHQRQNDDRSSPDAQEKARLAAELEKVTYANAALSVQLGEASKPGALPLWYRRVRNESSALSEGMSIYLAQLEAVLEEDLPRATSGTAAERAMALNGAAGAYVQIRGVHAACERLLQRLVEIYGDRISTEEVAVSLSLDAQEIEILQARRQRMLELSASQQQRRQVELGQLMSSIGALPKRKPGKPKGSKNKAKR